MIIKAINSCSVGQKKAAGFRTSNINTGYAFAIITCYILDVLAQYRPLQCVKMAREIAVYQFYATEVRAGSFIYKRIFRNGGLL